MEDAICRIMLDFDRLQRTPRFSRPRRPPMRVFYQPPRPVVRRPRFHNPRRPVHYSPKIEAPKQLYVPIWMELYRVAL